MLGAGAGAGDEQRGAEPDAPPDEPGERVAERRRARCRAPARRGRRTARRAGRQGLQRRHGAGEKPAQQRERAVAKAEFGLPDRQQHVDQVGVAVVQRMRGAGDRERAGGPRGGRRGGRGRHGRVVGGAGHGSPCARRGAAPACDTFMTAANL